MLSASLLTGIVPDRTHNWSRKGLVTLGQLGCDALAKDRQDIGVSIDALEVMYYVSGMQDDK